MKSIAFFTLLAATLVSAIPAPQTAGGPKFDPSGQKNVGNAKGLQFIGGQCLSTADCGSGCCAGPSGICSGVGAQFQAGKTGCGFPGAAGSASSSSSAAAAPTGAAGGANNAGSGSAAGAGAGSGAAGAGASTTPANGGPNFDPSGAKNVGNAKGLQFIGGQCLAASDCGSGCCAGPSGICSGVGAQTQNGKTGCGFGDAGAGGNSSASTGAGAGAGGANNAGSGSAAGSGAGSAAGASGAGSAAGNGASTTPANGGPQFDPAGAKNFGNQKGAQFIGGQCKNAADCGSGCCAGPSGICSGVGAQTQNGKTGCGFGDAAGAGAGGKRSLLAGLL